MIRQSLSVMLDSEIQQKFYFQDSSLHRPDDYLFSLILQRALKGFRTGIEGLILVVGEWRLLSIAHQEALRSIERDFDRQKTGWWGVTSGRTGLVIQRF